MPLPQQLGYVEITADVTTTATSATDVTGLTRTVAVGTLPVRVTFACSSLTSTVAGDVIIAQILRGATIIGGYAGTQPSGGGSSGGTCVIIANDNPAAGSYTYKVQFYRFSGSGTVKVSVPLTTMPASLRVEEVAA